MLFGKGARTARLPERFRHRPEISGLEQKFRQPGKQLGYEFSYSSAFGHFTPLTIACRFRKLRPLDSPSAANQSMIVV
jgi:hypothetical protein